MIGLLAALPAAFLVHGTSSLRKAELAWQAENYLAAAQSYARAAQSLPWRRDLWEKAGVAAAQGGDYSTAITHFEHTSAKTEEGWVWLATSHVQLGNFRSAISICEQGLSTFDSAALYRLLAYIHRSQKEWAEEKNALINQARLMPDDAYVHYRLGLLWMLDDPTFAYEELARASSLNPEVDSAAQTLLSALNVSATQTDPSAQKLTIGRALGLVQEWYLALLTFEQAVHLDEKNAEAWAWLGEAKQQIGQDGRVELDRALSLNRQSVNVRALRGLYWSRVGKYEQMLAEYLLAAEYEPENPRWRASVGEAYARLGDVASALVAYQRAVEAAPDNALYLRLLAVFCAENGVYVEEIGLPAAQKAQSLAPNDPLVLDALGFSYFSSGRFANAEQTLLQAIELAPEHFPAHLHLATTYLAQGNLPAAFNTLTFVRDADESKVYAEAADQLLEKYFP